MTAQDYPDPLGFLLDDPTTRPAAETRDDAHPASTEPAPVLTSGVFPTRRELRRMREEAERAAAAAAEALEVPPVAVDAPAETASVVELLPVAEPVSAEIVPAEIVPAASLSSASAPIDLAPVLEPAPVLSVPIEVVTVQSGPIEVVSVESAPIEPVPLEVASPAFVPADVPGIPPAPAAIRAETVAEPAVLSPVRPRRPVGRRQATTRPPRDSRSLRQRITATATMVLVGGIFASLTLPAYAFSEQQRATTVAQDTSTQNFADTSIAAAPVAARDSYSATSSADLKALYANAVRQKNLQAYLHSEAQALGDDYPWYDALDRAQGGGLSPLRYYYRECVDFVAWRLNRDAGYTSAPFKWDWSTLTPGDGNASGWKAAWIAHGWTTSSTPVVGSVAWFAANHVAYVNSVLPDGSVVLEEYNYNNDHEYGQRIVPASSVDLFLYPPPE